MKFTAPFPPADEDSIKALYPPDLQLVFLQIVHRHGERTPVRKRLEDKITPVWNLCHAAKEFQAIIQRDVIRTEHLSDSSSNKMGLESFSYKRMVLGPDGRRMKDGDCFLGQLTDIGRSSMTKLGTRLREIYVDKLKFLDTSLDGPETLFIRSTDFVRTLESVQHLADGLYPAGTRPKDFVLEVYTRNAFDENLYINRNCARLKDLTEQFYRAAVEITEKRLQEVSKKLSGLGLGEIRLDSHPSASGLLDSAVAAKANGIPIPQELEDVIEDLHIVNTIEWFYGFTQSQEMRRLGIGRLLGEITGRIEDKVRDDESTKKLKLAIYSGHDTTVGPLLTTLGGFDNKFPPFNSVILIELFRAQPRPTDSWWRGLWSKEEDQYYVRVRYNDQVVQVPECKNGGQHHPNGDTSLCTLSAFKRAVESQIPKNWAKECEARDE
ncbi:uncharacterized protein VTP21DRAFT_4743 [Calcarisporiella thermophila]|uniref:uncharacterized protein n=1 Tax=Calcarisporiella thermophila TaxID=911321 RepID=UPI003744864E